MQVDSTTAIQNSTTTSHTETAKASTSLDYEAFLKLLITQMKNQDPTNPTDPAEWMGQIASFSNVEQAIQTNAKLDALMTSMALSQVDGIIGHTITTVEGDISGKVASVRVITGGAVAVLENGTEVLLDAGVEIS